MPAPDRAVPGRPRLNGGAPVLKLILFLQPSPSGRGRLGAWLREYAPALGARVRATRLVLNLDNQPDDIRVHASTAAAAPYEAALQIWIDTPDTAASAADAFAALAAGLRPLSPGLHAWHVAETVVWNREPDRQGRLPGISYLGLLDFHADMPDSAAHRSWTLHAEAARAVHVGATRYRQNRLARRLTPDGPAARGISELYFPSREALVSGFFDSARGRAEIRRDTAHFISSATRLYTTEYVLL
jgi:hypothetical protein